MSPATISTTSPSASASSVISTRDIPTKAQDAALEELINYLRKRCGKVKGHDIVVRGHKQINPKPTDCPGDRFPA